MLYQITAPPAATVAKQADEFGRLLKHSQTLTIQFVTVAGRYKPSRARLVLIGAPARLADQVGRVIALLCASDDAMKPSAAVRQRPEWKHVALLVPTDPNAPPLDGLLLDGWESAFLSVAYRPGRALGRLLYCPEDRERVAALKLDGWQVIGSPNPLQLFANLLGRPWKGVPSLVPVPGAVAAPRTVAAERHAPAATDAPAPLEQELREALTNSPDGFLLGVTPEGTGVRLARHAMTLAVNGSQEARQRAVLALLQRGMHAGMGMVAAVDRSLLPAEALQTWESRVRLLDVQNIADSSAIPWREIAPDLLAQAIGGPSASLPALPSRFGAVLDTLGAESLRVPAVLGLATMPGDNLRGALAAGGLIVVPQDGDAASAIVARLLLAYLATPPAIGRGVLLLADPALAPPEALQQQAIQIVLGERGDALLRLRPADTGWKLSAPDGSPVAVLLPDLLAQPADGASALVDSIARELGASATTEFVVAEAPPIDATGGWWVTDERADDLDAGAPPSIAGAAVLADLDIADSRDALPANAELPPNEQLPGNLDSLLDDLLHRLMEDLPTSTNDAAIQAAVASADFAKADRIALAWAAHAPQLARSWLWQVVLAEEDADRAVAAARVLQSGLAGEHVRLAQAILAAMGGTEIASCDDPEIELSGHQQQIDSAVEGATTTPLAPVELCNRSLWPLSVDSAPALADQPSELVTFSLEQSSSLRRVIATAEHALPDAAHGLDQAVCPAADARAVDPLAPAAARATTPMFTNASMADLSDDAIRLAWQAGESAPQLVARMVAGGSDAASARARVRAIVSGRSLVTTTALAEAPRAVMSGIVMPDVPPTARAAANEPGAISAVTPPAAVPAALAGGFPSSSAEAMNAITVPDMLAGELDDRAIWDCWAAGKRSDEIVVAISGRRGGPRAEAARDRMYRVVIPRIIAALNCGDLADRLVAGEDVAADPRYPTLLQQIARSENAPSGNLERALAKRLIAARRELGP